MLNFTTNVVNSLLGRGSVEPAASRAAEPTIAQRTAMRNASLREDRDRAQRLQDDIVMTQRLRSAVELEESRRAVLENDESAAFARLAKHPRQHARADAAVAAAAPPAAVGAPRPTQSRGTAAAAAAVAAAGPVAAKPPQTVHNTMVTGLTCDNAQVEFFAKFFSVQMIIGVDTAVRVEEETSRLDGNGNWLPPNVRTLVIFAGGTSGANTSKNPLLIEAGQALAAARPTTSGVFAQGTKSSAARSVRILQFSSCVAICTETKTRFKYGLWPLMPKQQSCAESEDGTFRATYRSIESMTPAEVQLVVQGVTNVSLTAAAEDQLAGAAPRTPTAKFWTTQPSSDEIVTETLDGLGVRMSLQSRACDGAARQAFRTSLTDLVREYGRSNRAGRMWIIRRLFAFPRMHMRALASDTARSHHRETFAKLQLSGLVCTQIIDEEEDKRRNGPRPVLSAEQHADNCARKATKLAAKGQLGRAAAALVRDAPVDVDPAVRWAQLAELHPSGLPPEAFALPPTKLFSTDNIKVSDLRASAAAVSGSTPGLDGWTFEMLSDALENDEFARAFALIVIDILNADIDSDVCVLLSSSLLMGIPKGALPSDGTRPIALGSVLLKAAATRGIMAASASTQKRFLGTQFGCSTKNGGEIIAHLVRAFHRTGERARYGQPTSAEAVTRAPATRVTVTVDFKNAFNMPSRQSMLEATLPFPELVGLFAVSYAQPAPLYVDGEDGRHLWSQRGARQGTVEGPVIFALTLQNAIVATHACRKNVVAWAYLDDVTIMADTADDAEFAVSVLLAHAAKLGMVPNAKKCEVMFANSSMQVPADAKLLLSFKLVEVIKLLGASIASCNDIERPHLDARLLDKSTIFMARAALLPSPQMFAVIRTAGVPQLVHAVRVHEPDVTRNICRSADGRVEVVMKQWSSIPQFSDAQRLLMQLPTSLGGCGLTSMELIAAPAHRASTTNAQRAARGQLSRPIKQAVLTELMYGGVLDNFFNRRLVLNEQDTLRHLRVHALPGADSALAFIGAHPHPDVYGAYLRDRLMGDVVDRVMPDSKMRSCAGCGAFLELGGPWAAHVSSCVVAPGGHVTRRHNGGVCNIRTGLAEAGYQPDRDEPRHLHTYTCGCRMVLPHVDYVVHRAVCNSPKQALRTSGPDILFYDGAGATVAIDFTVFNPMANSNMNSSVEELAAAVTATKNGKYFDTCKRLGISFRVATATSAGVLGSDLAAMMNDIARRTFREPRSVRAVLECCIAYGTARARLAAETAQGIRPASIVLENVRLVQSFRHGPLPSAEECALPTTDPGLLSLPVAQPPQQGCRQPIPAILAPDAARDAYALLWRAFVDIHTANWVDAANDAVRKKVEHLPPILSPPRVSMETDRTPELVEFRTGVVHRSEVDAARGASLRSAQADHDASIAAGKAALTTARESVAANRAASETAIRAIQARTAEARESESVARAASVSITRLAAETDQRVQAFSAEVENLLRMDERAQSVHAANRVAAEKELSSARAASESASAAEHVARDKAMKSIARSSEQREQSLARVAVVDARAASLTRADSEMRNEKHLLHTHQSRARSTTDVIVAHEARAAAAIAADAAAVRAASAQPIRGDWYQPSGSPGCRTPGRRGQSVHPFGTVSMAPDRDRSQAAERALSREASVRAQSQAAEQADREKSLAMIVRARSQAADEHNARSYEANRQRSQSLAAEAQSVQAQETLARSREQSQAGEAQRARSQATSMARAQSQAAEVQRAQSQAIEEQRAQSQAAAEVQRAQSQAAAETRRAQSQALADAAREQVLVVEHRARSEAAAARAKSQSAEDQRAYALAEKERLARAQALAEQRAQQHAQQTALLAAAETKRAQAAAARSAQADAAMADRFLQNQRARAARARLEVSPPHHGHNFFDVVGEALRGPAWHDPSQPQGFGRSKVTFVGGSPRSQPHTLGQDPPPPTFRSRPPAIPKSDCSPPRDARASVGSAHVHSLHHSTTSQAAYVNGIAKSGDGNIVRSSNGRREPSMAREDDTTTAYSGDDRSPPPYGDHAAHASSRVHAPHHASHNACGDSFAKRDAGWLPSSTSSQAAFTSRDASVAAAAASPQASPQATCGQRRH